ncbi:MAG: TolC family protein [Candidatus Margulisbacteria bacterium]|nr:TolC family protein [Candidatus Margulisiibacteriota bacterium]
MRLSVLCILFACIMQHPVYSERLSLKEAVEEFKSNGIALKIYHLKLSQEKAKIRQVWSHLLPKIDVAAEQIHNDLRGTRQITSVTALDNQETNLQNLDPINALRLRVSLVQPIYDKNIPLKLKVSFLEYEAQAYAYKRTEQEQVLELAQLYYETAHTQQLILLAKKDVIILEKQLEEIKSKKMLKLNTRENVLQAEIALANSQQKRMEHRQNYTLFITKLKHKLGRNRKDSLNIEEKSLTPEFKFDIIETLGTLESALEQRSDLLQLLKEQESLKARIKTEKNRKWPVITFNTTYGFTNKEKFSVSSRDRDFSWGVEGSVRLFNGFETLSKIKEYTLLLEESKLIIELKKQEIHLEINDALYAMELSQKKQKDASIHRELAEGMVSKEIRKFELGNATKLDVLIAKKELYDAIAQESIRRYEFAGAISEYRYAMGNNPLLL